jgi:hypothetical protein
MTLFLRLALGVGCAAAAAPASAANPPHPDPCPPDPCPPIASCPVPCPPAAGPCRTPKVVVEMSQPEVRFVAPSCGSAGGSAGGAGGGGVAVLPGGGGGGDSRKLCSFLNLSINRSRTKLVGGGVGGVGQPVTTTVPAFATATIPIAFQTTQFTTATESALLGARGGVSQAELAELVRDAVRRESARADNGRQESAPVPAGPSCAELKTRVDRIEQRLEQIEKKVEVIAGKLDRLNAPTAGSPAMPVPIPPVP